MACESVELFNASFYIVASDAFTGINRCEIDVCEDFFVICDDGVSDCVAKMGLRLHHRDPEAALCDDLLFWAKDGAHRC